ncbi:chromodomain-helicase-dna-binding protein 3 [Ophiostoma piceae UAMH 11346]|uniref:Chromodomain-helicase-dna-binding protein 3 n=1 Tax=Ophiostoma piceae (strain UAMH 11346) TaxID=1262450 RepID=S3C4N1_OPHP1|nr:chromodomain-helicase-dna-binding protein 3 [Ophiostoma piceae UAMH 11346]
MDTSPLPSRTRPPGSSGTSGDNARRTPFTIAKAASLSRANSSSLSSKSSLQSSSSSRPSAVAAKPKPVQDDIEDSEEDDDDEEETNDDLAGVGGLASSPYFTQPTQPVTQPTQILKKPLVALRRGNSNSNSNGNHNSNGLLASSPSGPSRDSISVSIPSSSPLRPVPSVIEVPASSPMAPSSATPKRTAALSKLPQGRLAGLMAPVGTTYKSPAKAAGNDSDDDPLDNIISINDSSEDEEDKERARRRARGDIRPSSFHRGRGLDLHTESENDPPVGAPSKSNSKQLNEGTINMLIKKARIRFDEQNLKVADDDIRSALVENAYDLKLTVRTIFDESLNQELEAKKQKSRTATPIEVNKVPSMIRTSTNNGKKDMIRGFAYNASGSGTGTANTSRASTPATPSSQQSLKRGNVLDASPRPKRRRLVQGRKYREPSSPPPDSPVIVKKKSVAVKPKAGEASTTSKTSKTSKPAKGKPIVIESDEEEEEEAVMSAEESDEEDETHADDDDDDDESGDDGDSPAVIAIDDMDDDDVVEIDEEEEDDDDASFDVEKRVLEYFNTCTVDDLVAMLGAKARSRAETILSHRPFRTRASVTRIQTPEVAGARGRKKKAANIGEDIFDEVEEYVVALRAIDVVVTQCEQKGLKIRAALNRWNVDYRGSKKGTLTPLSVASPGGSPSDKAGAVAAYTPLPIPEEPKLMRGYCTMKGYQLYGLNWLWELYQRKFGCILADDMGLGKTCQVISFLSKIIEAYDEDDSRSERPWPNLVVVPPSTLANWKVEFAKFAPGINVTTYSGSVAERDRIFEEIRDERDTCHVVLTSYSQLSGKQDLDAMRKLSPNAAIFDEGHKMKNCNTAIYKSLKRIDANWRLILTGTPVQNNLMEMINLLRFIQPHLFERHVEKLDALFSQRFTLQDVSNGALLFSDRVRRARSILEPFILQRRKEQVLASMPKKTSRVIYCDLDETQRPIYEAYEQQFRRGKDKNNKEKAVVKRTAVTGLSSDQNNVWVQLRKSAIHAQLFRRYYDDKKVEKMAKILMAKVPQTELRQPDMGHLINELRDCSDFELHTWCRDYKCLAPFDIPDGHFIKSGKVQKLLELIEGYKTNGDRALVFSRFARVLNILREVMTFMGIRYVSLEGATRVEERQDIINEYTQDPEITVFLLTTGSGGTGINLTAANKVVIFDQSDNPQDDVQAENRAHRLGQTREVEIVKLVTRGTIEELVYKACQTKLELAERVTAGSASRAEVEAYEKMEREQGDGAGAVKAIEEEVRAMLKAKDSKGSNGNKEGKEGGDDEDTMTPPKSEDEEMSG